MTIANNEEKKYYQRLGIVPLSIDNIKRIIKDNIKNTLKNWESGGDIEKQTFRVISPAGIGKTQIALQICEELSKELNVKFNHILIKAPVLSRDDFLCPYPVDNSKFKMLYSDFVPTDKNSFGLFIIDELSRGDSSLQQLLWAVQNENRVHTFDFPKGWFVLCLDNPDDQEYNMNMIEDAAGLRRVLHIYGEVNSKSFLKYAKEKSFHPSVIEFIELHPDYLYDFNAQKVGMIFSNPASWERVSNILWGYCDNIFSNIQDLTILFDGLLNQSMSRMFIDYLKNRDGINPKDIFRNYELYEVKNNVIKMIENGNHLRLSQLMDSFIYFLLNEKPENNETTLNNIASFLIDIPDDIGAIFISKLGSLGTTSESYMYMMKIHQKLVLSNLNYRDKFYTKMINASKNSRM